MSEFNHVGSYDWIPPIIHIDIFFYVPKDRCRLMFRAKFSSTLPFCSKTKIAWCSSVNVVVECARHNTGWGITASLGGYLLAPPNDGWLCRGACLRVWPVVSDRLYRRVRP